MNRTVTNQGRARGVRWRHAGTTPPALSPGAGVAGTPPRPPARPASITAWRLAAFACLTLVAALAPACVEHREPIPASEIWPDEVTSRDVDSPILFLDRADGHSYGLPREGEPGIADLIGLLEGRASNQNYFFAPEEFEGLDAPLQLCRFAPAVALVDLPMQLEAVVTHHPRRFVKVEMCERFEDERYWGSFTIEDDTGGILVLRGARTSPFTFGDRVLITVRGLMLTFGPQPDTRAVITFTLEPLTATAGPELERPVLYSVIERPFGPQDSTVVRQIEGWVYQKPTNDNFNDMLVASYRVGRDVELELEGDALTCVRTCEGRCAGACRYADICLDACREHCAADVTPPEAADLPVCWSVGIDIDLGRRGFSPDVDSHVRVTGPVVNAFDRQLWVYSPNQVEWIDDER